MGSKYTENVLVTTAWTLTYCGVFRAHETCLVAANVVLSKRHLKTEANVVISNVLYVAV